DVDPGRPLPDLSARSSVSKGFRMTLSNTSTEPRLHARDLRLAYGERVVVDGLDLDVLEGTITAIIGPNGCGKSTLLRALGRLLRPSRGEVLLDGTSIHRMSTKQVAT